MVRTSRGSALVIATATALLMVSDAHAERVEVSDCTGLVGRDAAARYEVQADVDCTGQPEATLVMAYGSSIMLLGHTLP